MSTVVVSTVVLTPCSDVVGYQRFGGPDGTLPCGVLCRYLRMSMNCDI